MLNKHQYLCNQLKTLDNLKLVGYIIANIFLLENDISCSEQFVLDTG